MQVADRPADESNKQHGRPLQHSTQQRAQEGMHAANSHGHGHGSEWPLPGQATMGSQQQQRHRARIHASGSGARTSSHPAGADHGHSPRR
ncbi:hypothetical protein [Oryza sativa Japonica Group]|uniref:Uncharacterized protein n=1 Tax=Oryza sativa subsp. japonica TaxID=39947 RepID=Q8RZC6_ORYSJ|nr:hypothetical protein [Oryza sativa Japonica Group]